MKIEELTQKLNELINAIATLYDEKQELLKMIENTKAIINTHRFKDKYDRQLLKSLGDDIDV